MTALAFTDCETTGLDPGRHEVWEVGLILRRDGQADEERVWQLDVDLGKADPMALAIGRWYERRWPRPAHRQLYIDAEDEKRKAAAVRGTDAFVVPYDQLDEWSALFAELTDGAHLVGAVPSFDAAFLGSLLRKNHACPTWHYHLVDCEALAAGWLAGRYEDARWAAPADSKSFCAPPWDSEALSREIGVDPGRFDRHTALGDARWAKAIYDAVMGVTE